MTDTTGFETKYADVFKMAKAMIRFYYKNYFGFFKMMSLDKDDITQEIMLIVYQSLISYELKYKEEPKINARFFVRMKIHGKMYNILRDYSHKMILPMPNEENEESENESDFNFNHISKPWIKDAQSCNSSKKACEKSTLSFSDTDIEDLIRSFSETELEYNIFYGKIVEKKTLEELQKQYNLPNRTKANYLYKNVLNRIKSHFKSIDDLKIF